MLVHVEYVHHACAGKRSSVSRIVLGLVYRNQSSTIVTAWCRWFCCLRGAWTTSASAEKLRRTAKTAGQLHCSETAVALTKRCDHIISKLPNHSLADMLALMQKQFVQNATSKDVLLIEEHQRNGRLV